MVPALSPSGLVVLFHVNIIGSVALIIRLVDHIEAKLVAELVKLRGVRVMAGADRIDVMLLHHLEILLHLTQADHKAGDRIAVVAVYTAELDFRSIDQYDSVLYFDLPDSKAVCDDLLAALVYHRVKIRLFRIPQNRTLYRKG